MSNKFIKVKENFVCDNCGTKVVGTGYTNHCPNCLWSKHVDVNPGDRQSPCGGLMPPIGLTKKNGEDKIIHECRVCRQQKLNKVEISDNPVVLMTL